MVVDVVVVQSVVSTGQYCVMDGQRFINAAGFAGGIQHAEIISVPDRMVGLSK